MTEAINLVMLEELMPIEGQLRTSVYPFVLKDYSGLFFCFRLIKMVINSQWFDSNEIIESFFMFVVVLGLEKIIKLLEGFSIKP